jgi:Mn-containing catalase
VYEYLYRQIQDKEVRATIDFLLNREEAHNALFREALNKVQNTGSNKDFGVTKDSKLYFDLSTPGPSHKTPDPTSVKFESPNKEDRVLVHK